eukprot:CAMPEP_0195508434 /NCGR_PEP_ID=MMETSP0794_2-20130614/1637_1 /TAXON_ID=515487 /ORGANISM="Stephanopyxis turris, Strain CCMP 815" /LENGTH=598 /DNA_ID=CAMNT_0040635387 /DNA_START=534 /DNA_END=2330 /DNA_ORIENTATION=-
MYNIEVDMGSLVNYEKALQQENHQNGESQCDDTIRERGNHQNGKSQCRNGIIEEWEGSQHGSISSSVTRIGNNRPKFICPAHFCWTCGFDANKNGTSGMNTKKEQLFRCLECPNAFHLSCIPPLARFHELALLCHEHRTSKLPDLDMENSIQAQVETNAEKKLKKMKKKVMAEQNQCKVCVSVAKEGEGNAFFAGLRGDSLTRGKHEAATVKLDRELLYRLPVDIRDEVHSKPPSYSHTHCLRYGTNRPKRHPPSESGACHCHLVGERCGERCLNRMCMVECVGEKNNPNKNKYWNCECGPDCGNRMVGRRQAAKCRPRREPGKGWGLVALENLRKGDFVQEYVGEVIDEKEMKLRLGMWAKDHPHDPNFYVMQLEAGWYIDAREKGNLSRFVNHSCDPNCKLVPVNVAGFMRVAIVCITEVKSGEFLSYDYQFDTKHGDKFVCRCGAKNCRGTMKGGPRGKGHSGINGKSIDEKKTKKQLLTKAKQRIERDQKFLEEMRIRRKHLNNTGLFVPGADKNGSEPVANGPQKKFRYDAKHVFLWRNAVVGSDFSSRHWRWKDCAVKKGRTVTALAQRACNQNRNVDVIGALDSFGKRKAE